MKRIISTFFALTLLFSCCCSASASNIPETWASSTLSSYSAELYEGDSSGTLRVNFSVKSGHRADLIGITSIKIYKSNGTYVPYKIGKLQIQGFSEPITSKKIKQSYHITQKAARSRQRAAFLRGKLGRRQKFSKK